MGLKKILQIQMLNKLLCICIVLIMCLSCENRETYFNFQDVSSDGWGKNDTLYFAIDSSMIELNKPYQITFELASNVKYPYQNLWLYVQDNFEDSIQSKAYSVHYMIADDFGNWYGSGFGSIYQLSLSYKKEVIFREKRNYQVKVEHGMRDEPLKGIEKLGLKISTYE